MNGKKEVITSIALTQDIYDQLAILKDKHGAKSFSELIAIMLLKLGD